MSKVYATAMVAGDLAPEAGTGQWRPSSPSLVAVFGGLGVAASQVNAWLTVSFFTLMAICLAGALGFGRPLRRAVSRSLFDAKLANYPQRLELLALLLKDVEKVDSEFHNVVLSLFRDAGNKGLLSSHLEIGASNSLSRMGETVFSGVRELDRASTTTELYRAVTNLASLLRATGDVAEGIVRDLKRTGEFQPNTHLKEAYERFRQNYAAVSDNLATYLRENQALFGREVKFEPLRLPAL